MKRLTALVLVVGVWLVLTSTGQAQSNQGSVNLDLRASANEASLCVVSGVERVCRLAPGSRQLLLRIFHNGLPPDTRLGARLVSLGGLTVYSGDVRTVSGDGTIDYTIASAQVFTSLVSQAQDNINRTRDATREAEASPGQARTKMSTAMDAATQAKNALGMLERYGLDANLVSAVREMRDKMNVVHTKGMAVMNGASGAALTDAIRDAKNAAEAASSRMGGVRPSLDAQSNNQPFPQSANQEKNFTAVLVRDGEIAQTLEMSVSAAPQGDATSTPTPTVTLTVAVQPTATTGSGSSFQVTATPPASVTPLPTITPGATTAPTATTQAIARATAQTQATAAPPASAVAAQPAAPAASAPGQPTIQRGVAAPGQAPVNPGAPGSAAPVAAGAGSSAPVTVQGQLQTSTPGRPAGQPPLAAGAAPMTPASAAPAAPIAPTATGAPVVEARPTATPLRVAYGRVDLTRLTPMPNGDVAMRVDSATAARVAGARGASSPWLTLGYVMALSVLALAAVWMRRRL